MINYEEIADKYNYYKWKVEVLNYIEPMLKEPWHIFNDFITDNEYRGYYLRIAYDQGLNKEEVLSELYLYRIIDPEQFFETQSLINEAQ